MEDRKKLIALEKENKRLRRAEERLLESEERFRIATLIASDIIYEWNPNKEDLTWYGDVDHFFGYPPEGFPRSISGAYQLVHPDDSLRLEKKILQALNSGESFEDEYRVLSSSGKYIEILNRGRILYDKQGNIQKWIGTNKDISDRKKRESDKARIQEFFYKVFYNNPVPAIISSIEDEKIIQVNDAFINFTGYSKELLIDNSINHFDFFVDRARNLKVRETLYKRGFIKNQDTLIRISSGKIRNCIVSSEKIIFKDEPHIVSMAFDITPQKKALKALRESEMRYRVLTGNMLDMISESDVMGKIIYASPSHSQILGYDMDQIVGKTVFEYIHPEDLNGVINLFQKGIASQKKGRAEYRIRCLDGTYIWVETIGKTFLSENGVVNGAIFCSREVTERRKSEESLKTALNTLKQTQAQLVQSEKMASLGALVAGVAHEINTPIGVSITASSFLSDSVTRFNRYYEKGETSREDLKKILSTVNDASDIIYRNLDQAAEIISSFKKVAVDQSDESRRVFNIREYIGEVLLSLEPKFKRTKHHIDVRCQDNIVIYSWPGVFFQIISNLLLNALRHGFEGGESGKIIICAKKEGGQFVFKFNDNGIGMTSEVLKKVFDPFFTTKRNKGGTGLGLHVVYNLVTQTLNGNITCNSCPEKGTEFVISAPMEFI